jgi:hypothetical protein
MIEPRLGGRVVRIVLVLFLFLLMILLLIVLVYKDLRDLPR